MEIDPGAFGFDDADDAVEDSQEVRAFEAAVVIVLEPDLEDEVLRLGLDVDRVLQAQSCIWLDHLRLLGQSELRDLLQ